MAETEGSETLKRCRGGRHEGPNPLPLSAFNKSSQAVDGLNYCCRQCQNESLQRSRAANPEKHRESSSRWTRENREKSRAKNNRWRAAHLEQEQEQGRQWRDENRAAVFAHYGDTCTCCGSAERPTIDHIAGDGKERRLEHGRGTSFYCWLVLNGFPEGFQTLCLPCNMSKGRGERCQLAHSE